jgi:DNA-directed RNA polymerase specialized sigma24 family protein
VIATDSKLELPCQANGNGAAVSNAPAPAQANRNGTAFRSKRVRAPSASEQSGDQATRAAARADRLLIDRCLTGDELAWQDLYAEFHSPLLLAIRILLGRSAARHDLVDDIAQKVWCTVVDRKAELLSRFDAERGYRLSTFLAGLAKNEISRHFRAEWRRSLRETHASRAQHADVGGLWRGVGGLNSAMTEFLATLTPRELGYCQQHLLSLADTASEEISDVNRWQLHRRVRLKLCAFLKYE